MAHIVRTFYRLGLEDERGLGLRLDVVSFRDPTSRNANLQVLGFRIEL